MEPEEAKKILGIEQATSPVVSEPTELGPEAMKAMPPPQPVPSLSERLAAGKSAEQLAADRPPRRGPGRPPGRKNNATLAREAQEGVRKAPAQRMVTPPAKKGDDGLTSEQRQAAKLARAEKLAESVAETINDNLLLILMSMGCPSEILYKPGQEPKQVKAETSKYTELAQQLTLSSFQANIIGRFLAELEATETGGKVAGAVADGKGPLIVYGVLSLATAIQYTKGLADAYKKFEPMLKAYQEMRAQQEQQGFIRDQTGGA